MPHNHDAFYKPGFETRAEFMFKQSVGEPRVAYNHKGFVVGPMTVGKRNINIQGGLAHPCFVKPKKVCTRMRPVLKREVDRLPGPMKPRIA